MPATKQITISGLIANQQDIETPGAYLDLTTKQLHRVTSQALDPGHSPVYRVTGGGPFIKISNNPGVSEEEVVDLCHMFHLEVLL